MTKPGGFSGRPSVFSAGLLSSPVLKKQYLKIPATQVKGLQTGIPRA
jgi:hypothetical protein